MPPRTMAATGRLVSPACEMSKRALTVGIMGNIVKDGIKSLSWEEGSRTIEYYCTIMIESDSRILIHSNSLTQKIKNNSIPI